MRNRLVRAAIAIAALCGAFALSASPASAGVAKPIEGNQCRGYYVLGYQVIGPGIYCPE